MPRISLGLAAAATATALMLAGSAAASVQAAPASHSAKKMGPFCLVKADHTPIYRHASDTSEKLGEAEENDRLAVLNSYDPNYLGGQVHGIEFGWIKRTDLRCE